MESFPVPDINELKKSSYNEIVKNVEVLLKLTEEIKAEKLQTKIEQIRQRIEHSEDKIDQLVYDLYDVTPEEIKVVEGGDNE